MLIYKICHKEEWAQAVKDNVYAGSAADREDGFIHFSTAAQVPGTLGRFYADATELVLVAVEAARLGGDLKFEPSRGGELFPHLYGALPLAVVTWAQPLKRGAGGSFDLPNEGV